MSEKIETADELAARAEPLGKYASDLDTALRACEAQVRELREALAKCMALIEAKYPTVCAEATANCIVGDPVGGTVGPVYLAARAALARTAPGEGS